MMALVVHNMLGCTAEKIQQKIINIFKSFDLQILQIEIEIIGLPSVDFLDVTLDLKRTTVSDPTKIQTITLRLLVI